MFRKLFSIVFVSFFSFGVFAQDLSSFMEYSKRLLNDGISLYFSDSQTAKPIKGLEIHLESEDSDFEETATTDRKGFATFSDLDDGEYIVTINSDIYVEEEFYLEILAGIPLTWRFSVTKAPESGSLRIVLDWGESPRDLDLHLEQSGGYHISYRSSRTAADGSAWLDVDCISGYGPETITVGKWTRGKVYTVYVVDYSDRGRTHSDALSKSGATARVYNENGLVKSFSVPSGNGNRWDICTIKNGEVTDAGTISELY